MTAENEPHSDTVRRWNEDRRQRQRPTGAPGDRALADAVMGRIAGHPAPAPTAAQGAADAPDFAWWARAAVVFLALGGAALKVLGSLSLIGANQLH